MFEKIAYMMPDNDIVRVVSHIRPKKDIEAMLGPLTDAQYEAHVKEVSIPKESYNVVFLSAKDVPNTKEARLGWALADGKIVVDKDKHEARSTAQNALIADYAKTNFRGS